MASDNEYKKPQYNVDALKYNKLHRQKIILLTRDKTDDHIRYAGWLGD